MELGILQRVGLVLTGFLLGYVFGVYLTSTKRFYRRLHFEGFKAGFLAATKLVMENTIKPTGTLEIDAANIIKSHVEICESLNSALSQLEEHVVKGKG